MAQWTMRPDWHARWILASEKVDASTPLPLFRHAFEIHKPVSSAEVHVCGLGFHEVRLNGNKLGP